MNKRPKCINTGCELPRQLMGTYSAITGYPRFRKYCTQCHSSQTAKKHGMKSLAEVVAAKRGMTPGAYAIAVRAERAKAAGMTMAEYNKSVIVKRAKKMGITVTEMNKTRLSARAKKAGMTIAEFNNRTHPYRKHRKTFCENKDKRLGYVCRNKIRISRQLEVDHINGNPTDHRPKNLQTLCLMCHAFKTELKGDSFTAGRKTMGIRS